MNWKALPSLSQALPRAGELTQTDGLQERLATVGWISMALVFLAAILVGSTLAI